MYKKIKEAHLDNRRIIKLAISTIPEDEVTTTVFLLQVIVTLLINISYMLTVYMLHNKKGQ